MSKAYRVLQNALALAFIATLAMGCESWDKTPGLWLSGELVTTPVDDWSFANDRFVDLETRPEDPYSVELNYIVRDGKLYIDPAEGRRWLDHIRADPRVRVRFGNRLYSGTALLRGRPGELEGFDADRFIYEIESRPASGEAP